jgi:TatD DNase family protein
VGKNPLGAVDTHCHLFLLDDPAEEVVRAANRGGVSEVVCVGIDPTSSRRSLELAGELDGVWASAGMHPHTAADLDDPGCEEIERLLEDPLVVAVGETGLDHFRMLSPPDVQERVLRLHCRWSRDTGKPLVVHVRDAWEDALRVLGEEGAERVVIHCFTGDAAIAAECVARGYFISFAGNLTYPPNHAMREAAASVPLERLLTETDSPFLAPQRMRGRPNEPANTLAVVEELARLRPESFDEILHATAASARVAFPDMART